jgi:hypothetical protein
MVSVSDTGVLVIRKFGQDLSRLVWRDRTGREVGVWELRPTMRAFTSRRMIGSRRSRGRTRSVDTRDMDCFAAGWEDGTVVGFKSGYEPDLVG